MNDAFKVIHINIVASVTADYFQFTRNEVLVKLLEFAANAAQVFGPYSDEAEALLGDIDAVKAGGNLGDFTWVFPELDEILKGAQ